MKLFHKFLFESEVHSRCGFIFEYIICIFIFVFSIIYNLYETTSPPVSRIFLKHLCSARIFEILVISATESNSFCFDSCTPSGGIQYRHRREHFSVRLILKNILGISNEIKMSSNSTRSSIETTIGKTHPTLYAHLR